MLVDTGSGVGKGFPDVLKGATKIKVNAIFTCYRKEN
jgi:hypothetical protein